MEMRSVFDCITMKSGLYNAFIAGKGAEFRD